MSIRPVKRLIRSKPTRDGAGVQRLIIVRIGGKSSAGRDLIVLSFVLRRAEAFNMRSFFGLPRRGLRGSRADESQHQHDDYA